MILVIVVVVVLAFAALAVVGYRMGPAPGGRAITQRDRRLQMERADRAAFRSQANPNLRSDREEAVRLFSASSVRVARGSREGDGSINETEALADALVHLDHLEREATGTSVGPLVADVVVYLARVGVMNDIDPFDPELAASTHHDLAANPGIVVRIVGARDLSRWP